MHYNETHLSSAARGVLDYVQKSKPKVPGKTSLCEIWLSFFEKRSLLRSDSFEGR